MDCREFEADVVDLARGAGVGAAEGLLAHLERCAGCAARLERERSLSAALKAMADAEPPSARAAEIEERLLAAFADRRAGWPAQRAARRTTFVTVPAARVWLAAAAVLVLAVAAWQGVARWPAPEGSPAGRGTGPGPAEGGAQPNPGPAADGQALRFVTLPTAVGLPALESGRIVRVDVPTAMLPAFGFDVTPEPASGALEADVLVGQDGQPRAIRFVTLDEDPRRPQ